MEKEKQYLGVQLKQVEQDYARYFGQPQPSQETEISRQGYFTQFSAYENVRVTYAATTGR